MKITNKTIIIGNWKMNGFPSLSSQLVRQLTSVAANDKLFCDVIICPPYTLLDQVGRNLKNSPFYLGAQDCFSGPNTEGAFTGDISASMLAEHSCSCVIIGHSERRSHYNEAGDVLKNKLNATYKAQMVGILCVGETEEERLSGETTAIIAKQLKESLSTHSNSENTIIAYEPRWAIGTGKTPTIEEIADIHAFIKNYMEGEFTKINSGFEKNSKIVYGGSVNKNNSEEILGINNVGGLLIGGASLKFDDFYTIIKNKDK